jgi:5-methyltetrahydropteroyltriglutamate--homocysteine methyltransferase
MKTSDARILTTHVGSLPRPAARLKLLRTKVAGQPYEDEVLQEQVLKSVDAVVTRQAEIGIDVVSDGEMPKPSFLHYVKERLSGFAPTQVPLPWYLSESREVRAFPEHYAEKLQRNPVPPSKRVICNGPLRHPQIARARE